VASDAQPSARIGLVGWRDALRAITQMTPPTIPVHSLVPDRLRPVARPLTRDRYVLPSPQGIIAEQDKPSAVRFHEIDGIRGWASLSVVLFHLFWEIFGVIVPGIRNTATGFFLDGQMAVAIFFVLSGEALSSGYFSRRGSSISRLAVRRYPRLVVPIFAACLIVSFLSHCGLVFNAEAGDIVKREDWLGNFLLMPPPTILQTIKYSFVDVFIQSAGDPGAMNAFLWTMKYELIGSFLVFGLLILLRRANDSKYVIFVTLVVALMPMSTRYLSCFLAGMLFAKMRADGSWQTIQNHRLSTWSWLLILPIGLLDGRANLLMQGPENKPLYAIVIMFAIFANKPLCRFFSSAPSRFLGRISFPLYLVHFPVFISLTSWMIIKLSDHGQLSTTGIAMICAATIAAFILSAIAFLPVERLTKQVETIVARTLLRGDG
jgi:peptidoglycan/LPS O-acetylase OafA/YrhL